MMKPWTMWLSWLGVVLDTKRLLVRFLVRANAQFASSIPGKRSVGDNQSMVALSLSFFPPLPLQRKLIKIF